jgi:antibiotic biosynthesis monooxygenase (ABM) superfamily enzyme
VIKLSGDQNEATWVICRSIKPGRQKDYDDWLERYLTSERKAHGYIGTTIIIPGGSKSSLRYIIHRFTDRVKKETWENSQESIKLLEEVNNYSERYHETATGLETWFDLPDLKTQISVTPPPRWKMAIVVFIAAYAISSLSRSILNPFLEQWPLLGNTVIYTAILVASLTYFAMPILSQLLRQWLYPKAYNQ